LGLDIDAAGFIKLTDIINYLKGKGFNVDEDIIQKVVDTNDKKRF
jgi:RNA:NAD 2'-phosphotransferase (TPT1/KptA family)